MSDGTYFERRFSPTPIRVGQSSDVSLGDGYNLPLALTADRIGLPDTESYLSNVWNQAWPQVLAFSGAVLALLAGVMIVKAFQK